MKKWGKGERRDDEYVMFNCQLPIPGTWGTSVFKVDRRESSH